MASAPKEAYSQSLDLYIAPRGFLRVFTDDANSQYQISPLPIFQLISIASFFDHPVDVLGPTLELEAYVIHFPLIKL